MTKKVNSVRIYLRSGYTKYNMCNLPHTVRFILGETNLSGQAVIEVSKGPGPFGGVSPLGHSL